MPPLKPSTTIQIPTLPPLLKCPHVNKSMGNSTYVIYTRRKMYRQYGVVSSIFYLNRE